MDEYELRTNALRIAADRLECYGNTATLLDNARYIESYLTGTSEKPKIDNRQSDVLDFNATFAPYDPTELQWSGTAHDLVRTFNGGHTLVCKARQIGMTTLLSHFAAAKAKQGQKILFFATNRRLFDSVKDIISHEDKKATKNVIFASLNTALKETNRGTRVDYIIADGLAYLPHRLVTDFLAAILPLGGTRIFVSEAPRQPMGLFYDLWQHSLDYQKVMLTWHQPLYRLDKIRMLAETVARKEALGQDAYRSEFECHFASDTKR